MSPTNQKGSSISSKGAGGFSDGALAKSQTLNCTESGVLIIEVKDTGIGI